MRSIAILFFVIGFVIGVIGCAEPERGEPGLQGAPGMTGPQGPVGNDGKSVTVVSLCPGLTVYPSTFVEVSFCIAGRLYGTYSTHGGFSTELVPGAYNSNTVGSRCNFVVQPNCVVVN